MKMNVRTLLLPAIALMTATPSMASVPTPADSGRCIPLERGDGASPVIMARVNGAGPFAFILDTGSSGTTLDERRIKQLGLLPDGPSEQAQGMGGAIDVRLFRLDGFEAGPLVLRDMMVPQIPAPPFDSHDVAGLAGVDIFGRHLVAWRWDQSCAQLGDTGSRPSGPGWKRVRSRWLKPWKVMLPVRIGKATGWGLLDTGAQKSVLSPGFARATGLGRATPSSTDAISGVEGRETSLTVYTLPKATVGHWRYDRMAIGVGALPLFDRLGGMDQPVAVIGMDWIGTGQFAIDYGSQQVWQHVARAPAGR